MSQVVPSWGWSRLLMQDSRRTCSCGQYWGVHTDQRDWALGGVQVQSQESFRATTAQFHHVQQAIPHCEANSMLLGLVRALSLPTERVVLLLQFPRACQLCFLQGGNIGIQSLELIVYDSPFPGITNVPKIFREAQHQGLRDILDNIPVQELVFCRILLLLPGAIVYYPQFGCLPVSKHPMKQADCGGTTPYWLGAAQLKVGDSFPVRFENLSHHWK